MGEGAIDRGGPRREFFRLLALKASEEFFQGKPGSKFFANNVVALQVYIVYYNNIIIMHTF